MRSAGKRRLRLALALGGAILAAASALAADRLPGEVFRDCDACDEMVVVPAGDFVMGSTQKASESPPHKVRLHKAFAIARREVTFAEWDRCVAAGGCKHIPARPGLGTRRPSGDQSRLGRRQAICRLDFQGVRKNLPAADRGRMGICGQSGHGVDVLVGQGGRQGPRQMRRLRRQGPGHGADRLFPPQRLRALRHLGQRRRMGRGLLEPLLRGRAGRRLRLDQGGLPAARAARRLVSRQGARRRLGRPLSLRLRCALLCERVSGRARPELSFKS